MTVDITVTRGSGDRPGQEISSPMMISQRVATARGAYEVDRSCSQRLTVSGSLAQTDYVRRGLIVEVAEAEEIWRGMTTDFDITWEMGDAGSYAVNASIVIEREDRE